MSDWLRSWGINDVPGIAAGADISMLLLKAWEAIVKESERPTLFVIHPANYGRLYEASRAVRRKLPCAP